MKENSIEEDIKNAEHFIKSIKTDKEYKEDGWHGYYNKEIVELARILEHILSDYKRVLKENEVSLKENEELKFKDRSRIIGKYGDTEIHDVINRILSNDYIPIQKVKDKISERQFELQQEYKDFEDDSILIILQELLEGRK
nr:MAG TPA: hypothetical protein [Caudoviricetes sp.]